MVALVYIDESFNKNEFWVTGLRVPEDQAISLEAALDQVVAAAAAAYGVSPEAELHGNHLMNGKKDWSALSQMFRARFGVFTKALEAIAAVPGISAFQYGLDLAAQRRKYSNPLPPRQILIGHLAQRLHNQLAQGEVLALVVDDNPAQQSIRKHIRDFKLSGTWSKIDSRPLANVLDTVYFAPSCESRLLQAADLVSYCHFRARTTPGTSSSYQAGQDAWAIVRPFSFPSLWTP